VNSLNTVLFFLSGAMLLPVIVLLLLLFAQSVILIGGFFGIATGRMKTRAAARTVLDKSRGLPLDREKIQKSFFGASLFVTCLHKLLRYDGARAGRAHLLTEFELKAAAQCEKSKMIMRVGPMLGLMGTLIPMGPALVGLAAGDIATMAVNMQVAFATTVIGLFVGAIGFIVQQIRQRWANEDLQNLVYVYELVSENGSGQFKAAEEEAA
jgi:biopolymer transport protein ExbB/TolQ